MSREAKSLFDLEDDLEQTKAQQRIMREIYLQHGVDYDKMMWQLREKGFGSIPKYGEALREIQAHRWLLENAAILGRTQGLPISDLLRMMTDFRSQIGSKKREFPGSLSPRYLDLFSQLIQKIGLTPNDVDTALYCLIEEKSSPDGLDKSARLFKTMAEGKIPYIVLAEGNRHKQIESASLIPDPYILDITCKGYQVPEVFSSLLVEYGVNSMDDPSLVVLIKEITKSLLNENPNTRLVKPNTIAISGANDSLSFGYPFPDVLQQIKIGAMTV